MTDRPMQLDLELDAIDEAFKVAIGGMYRDLQTYSPAVGVGPKTVDEAKKLARDVLKNARAQRAEAIALINEENPK